MTSSEYRDKFGPDFKANEGKPWFVALVKTLQDNHPLRRLTGRADGDKLAGAVVYLNEIAGYEAALEVLQNISTEPTKEAPEPPSEYPDA